MRFYRDSDVLVFPSLSDGFGMAQIEAQACALADRRVAFVRPRRRKTGSMGCCSMRCTGGDCRRASGVGRRSAAARHGSPRNSTTDHWSGMSDLGAALLQLEPSDDRPAMIDPWFLNNLVCPVDHQRLRRRATR